MFYAPAALYYKLCESPPFDGAIYLPTVGGPATLRINSGEVRNPKPEGCQNTNSRYNQKP